MTSPSFDATVTATAEATTTTTTTARRSTQQDQVSTGAGFGTTAVTTSRRTVLQFFRTPQILFMGSIQGALFLFMFRYVFGGAINPALAAGAAHAGVQPLEYVNFLVPGFLVTVILWTGMSAAAGVAEESATGVHDRLRSLPIPRAAVMAGRSMADGALVAWGIFVTACIGLLIGWRPSGGFGKIVLGFAMMLIAGYCFTWIFITIGLISGNAQAAQGMSMLVIPFSFISAANVPVKTMPGWMQPFAANQPVTVIVNAVRSQMVGGTQQLGIGHTPGYWAALSLLWCAGIMAVFAFLAVHRFSKMK